MVVRLAPTSDIFTLEEEGSGLSTMPVAAGGPLQTASSEAFQWRVGDQASISVAFVTWQARS